MAATGFRYRENGNADANRIFVEIVLADSTAFDVGNAVKLSAGTLVLWGVGGTGLGIIESFVKADGSPVTDNGAGGDFSGTYTTSASNTVLAKIDISTTSIYSVGADATLGTTNNSDDYGVNCDCLADSDQLDESSTEVAGTSASFFSHGPDPDSPTDTMLVSIQESMYKI